MYWHVLLCINIYTPQKVRIHECIGMYCYVSTYIPPKKLEFMNVLACITMYQHIYTPKKSRIHECIGMYYYVSTYIPPKNLEFMNVLACIAMYQHIYPPKS